MKRNGSRVLSVVKPTEAEYSYSVNYDLPYFDLLRSGCFGKTRTRQGAQILNLYLKAEEGTGIAKILFHTLCYPYPITPRKAWRILKSRGCRRVTLREAFAFYHAHREVYGAPPRNLVLPEIEWSINRKNYFLSLNLDEREHDFNLVHVDSEITPPTIFIGVQEKISDEE